METKTIAADFSAVDIYSKIEDGLAGLEIGVLGKTAAGARATSLFIKFDEAGHVKWEIQCGPKPTDIRNAI